MAISPEQLDIKKLAKLFLLKSDLEANLNKEMIRAILEAFSAEDWDDIRDNIFETSPEKMKLRQTIRECNEFLDLIRPTTSNVNIEGKYPNYAGEILEAAIAIASAIARETYDGSEISGLEGRKELAETNAALIHLKQRVYSACNLRHGASSNSSNGTTWYGYRRVYKDNVKWQPAKRLYGFDDKTGDRKAIWISIEDIPADITKGAFIRGLYLRDETTQREYLITRQTVVDKQLISSLGGDFKNVTIIDGTIINDTLLCSYQDIELASLISSYFGRPVNAIPVHFNAMQSGMIYEEGFAAALKTVLGSEDLGALPQPILSHLNINKANTVTQTSVINENHCALTAVSRRADGSKILVDNKHHVITGAGVFTNELKERLRPGAANAILAMSNGAVIKDIREDREKGVILVNIESANGKHSAEYMITSELVLIDQQAEEVNGKYYSKYHPVDKSKDWVPSVLIDDFYISTEPVSSSYRLYKDNANIKHVVGVVIEENGTIYTRHNAEDLYSLITDSTNEQRFKHAEVAYYNGHIFAKEDKTAEMNDYLKYLSVFKTGDVRQLSFVQSAFKPITVNVDGQTIATGEQYWEGKASDYALLPNTRELCKKYLNISAYKTLPDNK